jgi:hypothetical protein
MAFWETWQETLSRQHADYFTPMPQGPGGYPLDLSFAEVFFPLLVGHLANIAVGATDPLSWLLPKRVAKTLVWAGLTFMIPLAFAANFFDLMGTTNGTGRGGLERMASIRQWIDWWEINVGINFAMADILYELLFSFLFILTARYFLTRGSSSVVVPLALFVYIKWTDLLSWQRIYDWWVYSPLEFWHNLTTVWNPKQGGTSTNVRGYI